MKSILALAAIALSAPFLCAEVPGTVAIKDAHIVTVSGADLEKGTVVLRKGLIEEVGTNVTVPRDAWVIDGAGLTVYPGFIDGLSTWGIPGAAAATAGRAASAAATTAQTPATPTPANAQAPAEAENAGLPNIHGPEDRPQTYSFERAADLVTPTDNRLEAARAAGFTSAATFPNRGIVEGLGAIIELSGDRGRDMVVAQPIGQQILFRVGGFGMGRAFPASLMGNIAYIRQLYLDLNQYEEAKQIYAANPSGSKRPEYDHDLEGLMESPRILLPADQSQQIDRMVAFGQELKTPFVLYGLHEAFKRVDEIKQANVPALISLKWPVAERDANPEDIPNYRDLLIREQSPAVAGMFAKAGVKFAFYSDGVDAAPDLKKAVKKAIDAGLSRADAIRALTLSAAEIYGVADRMGSVEKGKIANVVVMKGDAFDDKSTVEYVFVDGTMYKPSKELQQGPPNGGAGGRRGATTPAVEEQGTDGGRN